MLCRIHPQHGNIFIRRKIPIRIKLARIFQGINFGLGHGHHAYTLMSLSAHANAAIMSKNTPF